MCTKKYLNIYELFGDKLCVEDAVILRNQLIKDINCYDVIEIDFKNVIEITDNFYSTLLTTILETYDRDVIHDKISFKNVKDLSILNRAFYGTAMINM